MDCFEINGSVANISWKWLYLVCVCGGWGGGTLVCLCCLDVSKCHRVRVGLFKGSAIFKGFDTCAAAFLENPSNISVFRNFQACMFCL